jgi:hypothetical protein
MRERKKRTAKQLNVLFGKGCVSNSRGMNASVGLSVQNKASGGQCVSLTVNTFGKRPRGGFDVFVDERKEEEDSKTTYQQQNRLNVLFGKGCVSNSRGMNASVGLSVQNKASGQNNLSATGIQSAV